METLNPTFHIVLLACGRAACQLRAYLACLIHIQRTCRHFHARRVGCDILGRLLRPLIDIPVLYHERETLLAHARHIERPIGLVLRDTHRQLVGAVRQIPYNHARRLAIGEVVAGGQRATHIVAHRRCHHITVLVNRKPVVAVHGVCTCIAETVYLEVYRLGLG